MLSIGEDKSKIISYIESLSSDNKKDLNDIAKIINRVSRQFNDYHKVYHFYNYRQKKIKKRKAGSGYGAYSEDGITPKESWLAGDVITKKDFDHKSYFVVYPQNMDRVRDFVSHQFEEYKKIIQRLESIDGTD